MTRDTLTLIMLGVATAAGCASLCSGVGPRSILKLDANKNYVNPVDTRDALLPSCMDCLASRKSTRPPPSLSTPHPTAVDPSGDAMKRRLSIIIGGREYDQEELGQSIAVLFGKPDCGVWAAFGWGKLVEISSPDEKLIYRGCHMTIKQYLEASYTSFVYAEKDRGANLHRLVHCSVSHFYETDTAGDIVETESIIGAARVLPPQLITAAIQSGCIRASFPTGRLTIAEGNEFYGKVFGANAERPKLAVVLSATEQLSTLRGGWKIRLASAGDGHDAVPKPPAPKRSCSSTEPATSAWKAAAPANAHLCQAHVWREM